MKTSVSYFETENHARAKKNPFQCTVPPRDRDYTELSPVSDNTILWEVEIISTAGLPQCNHDCSSAVMVKKTSERYRYFIDVINMQRQLHRPRSQFNGSQNSSGSKTQMSGLRNQLDFSNPLHSYTLGHHLADWIESLSYVKDLFKFILFLRDILLIFIRISFCEHLSSL